MNVIETLYVPDGKGNERAIEVGIPENGAELEDAFRLRFLVYSSRGYIDGTKYREELEHDHIDGDPGTIHIIARTGGRTIGYVRLIRSTPLPTERYFTFKEPEEMTRITTSERAELGRLIIIPPDAEGGDYLPRGVLLLLLIRVLLRLAEKNGLRGGYAFIKHSLRVKLARLRLPFREIVPFAMRIPEDDPLYGYFTSPTDPVIPIFFTVEQFAAAHERLFRNLGLFESRGVNTLALKNNLYTRFLRKLRII